MDSKITRDCWGGHWPAMVVVEMAAEQGSGAPSIEMMGEVG